MPKLVSQLKQKHDVLIHSRPISPYPSFPSPSTSDTYAKESNSPSSSSKISPVILLVIVILAIIFFISGLLHLLFRFLVKRPSFYSSVSQSNRNPDDNSSSEALQRQLQQLFRLHDSGLDQALIDALPVFYYRNMMGLKEPFDCAVCLCEFSDEDKLRLLPMCSHAFHINCIDTWLLSNSTCPLCRATIVGSNLDTQMLSLDYFREFSSGCANNRENINPSGQNHKANSMEDAVVGSKRVYSVRLGKFKSASNGEREEGETSSSNLDARRCYSLGSCQYVLGDSDLQVSNVVVGNGSLSLRVEKLKGKNGNSLDDGDMEGKKICKRNRGESFSVSKIWLWSNKKSKYLDQAVVRGV